MGKIILVTALVAALEKAATLEKAKSVASQAIDSVKAYEADQVEKQNKIDALNNDLSVRGENLNKANKDLATANEELAASNELVAELSAKLEKAEENRGNPNLVVTIKKKDYEIIGNKFQTAKGSLTAEELAKDEELLLDMIAKGSGAIIAR